MSDPLEILFAAMERTGIPVAKFAWATQPEPPWMVVSRTGDGGSLWSDSTLTDEVQEDTVDLFTREAGAEHMRTVQDALKALGWPFELYLVLYEQDTRLVHYQWVWRQ